MSTVNIGSSAQFSKLLSSSTIVVADFYADWCGPCKAIAPTYESLATKHSKPNRVTFTKINVDNQQEIAQQYGVRAMPTFLIFRSGSVITTIRGADTRGLTSGIESAVKLASPSTPAYSSAGRTLGGSAPRTGQSLSRPWNIKSMIDTLISFFGLYLYTLFSLDPYGAGESSPFNVNRRTGEAAAETNGRKSGAGTAPQVGKRVGTLSDIAKD